MYASTGEPLTTGFDQYGYNYQAYQYIGYYGNYQRPPEPVDWGYQLMMKWNDAWLSNMDCDGDGKLDRHYGFSSYIGSGAWLTNHQKGVNEDGTHWEYFVKIVAKPNENFDCEEVGGSQIWDAFCIIQQVSNDPSLGEHGILTLVNPAGFGAWK